MDKYYGEFTGVPIINGDVLESNADFIVHQVNCQGIMGSGVAKQVKNKYPHVFEAYKDKCFAAMNVTCNGDSIFERTQSLLGDVLFVCADRNNPSGQQIANLFAQHGFGYDGKCYTDYSALQKCLNTLNQYAKGKSVAIPYMMSCHRGGGDWDVVSTMIIDTLKDCDVTFYRYSE